MAASQHSYIAPDDLRAAEEYAREHGGELPRWFAEKYPDVRNVEQAQAIVATEDTPTAISNPQEPPSVNNGSDSNGGGDGSSSLAVVAAAMESERRMQGLLSSLDTALKNYTAPTKSFLDSRVTPRDLGLTDKQAGATVVAQNTYSDDTHERARQIMEDAASLSSEDSTDHPGEKRLPAGKGNVAVALAMALSTSVEHRHRNDLLGTGYTIDTHKNALVALSSRVVVARPGATDEENLRATVSGFNGLTEEERREFLAHGLKTLEAVRQYHQSHQEDMRPAPVGSASPLDPYKGHDGGRVLLRPEAARFMTSGTPVVPPAPAVIGGEVQAPSPKRSALLPGV